MLPHPSWHPAPLLDLLSLLSKPLPTPSASQNPPFRACSIQGIAAPHELAA